MIRNYLLVMLTPFYCLVPEPGFVGGSCGECTVKNAKCEGSKCECKKGFKVDSVTLSCSKFGKDNLRTIINDNIYFKVKIYTEQAYSSFFSRGEIYVLEVRSK